MTGHPPPSPPKSPWPPPDHRVEPRFRLLFDQAPLGILLVEARTGRIIRANQCFARLVGRTPAELEQLDWMSITHPEDLVANRLGMEQINARETSTYHAVKRYLRPDGSAVWTNMTTSRVHANGHDQLQNLTMVEDITAQRKAKQQIQEFTARLQERVRDRTAALEAEIAERQKTEQELMAIKANLEATLAGMTDALFIADTQGHFTFFNEAAARFHRFSSRSELSETLLDYPDIIQVFTPAGELLSVEQWPISRGLQGVQGDSEEYHLRRADTGETWIGSYSYAPIRDGNGKISAAVVVARDISSQREAEERLRASEQAFRELSADLEKRVAERTAELKQANAAKTEFLTRMSHEIRTPLYSILGLAQMINREPLSQHQEDMLRRIQEAGQSLMGILNDILDLSKIESGFLRLEIHPFDLAQLLTKLAGIFGPLARSEGIELRIPSPAVPLGRLLGDGLRLEQVLNNLIGNAIKFTDQGEIVLEVDLLEATPAVVRLRFTVRDTGIGISPETLARLFTPFTQGEQGNSRRFGGTGLGLAISKRLVELMGGEIGAESQPGQGSTFWFELTLEQAPVLDREWSVRPPPAEAAQPHLTGMRVLVVDDSAEHRDLMAQALIAEGASVSQASDGAQALDHLRTHPEACDLVLMDLQMPVIDGFTATRRIREELGLLMLPVIALTAGVLPEQRRAALEAGVDDILTKPIDLDQIGIKLWPWAQHLPADVAPPALPAEARTDDLPPPAGAPAPQGPAEPFPDISGINSAKASKVLAGDRVLFLKLLRGFVAEYADLIPALRGDLRQGLWDSAARRLHKLSGRCGYIGAMGILRLAQSLEEALLAGETDINERLADLEGQIESLFAASSPWTATGHGVEEARS